MMNQGCRCEHLPPRLRREPLFGVVALFELILFGVTVGVLTDPLILFRSVLSVLGLEARLWGRRHRHVS
jgi:hypothetical protein